jgi:UDP-N-acetylmuramate: L-alanyl-gamma-D-glutamyl-meso-diaminopimelate ligase
MGCWTPLERFTTRPGGAEWRAGEIESGGGAFTLFHSGEVLGRVEWPLTGVHNVENALAAVAAARHVGVPPQCSIEALPAFRNVKRRMELRGERGGVRVYDDFAHHPTAIATTLQGLRAKVGGAVRILAVLEPRSNTMRMGVQAARLPAALAAADEVLVYASKDLGWEPAQVFAPLGEACELFDETEKLIRSLAARVVAGDQVVIMSNGGFEGIHQRLLDLLQEQEDG